MKNLIFLCVSTAIIIFTVVVLNNAPIINGYVGSDWYDESCQNYVDLHKYNKDKKFSDITWAGISSEEDKNKWLDLLIEGKNKCYRNKAMIGLEYSAFNFNIVFGFTCALLGLFNYLKIGNIGKIIGIIGLGSGVIGFVLTLVYIIYSGIIFTQDVVGKEFTALGTSNIYPSGKAELKIRADGAFAEWDDSKKVYVCLYYEKDNEDSLYLTYSDYGNKHLNYRTKDEYPEENENYEYFGCFQNTPYGYATCKTKDESNNPNGRKTEYFDAQVGTPNRNKKGDCDYYYYYDTSAKNYKKKNIYDRWVTTIVFGCFIFVLDLGLAIFGFLIFKDGGSSGSPL
jgi:hypothetical protein